MPFIPRIPPPAIKHVPERPANYKRMVEAAAKSIHLRQQATRLLTLYASQANGFRPAQGFIESKTGIPAKKISDVRARLARCGIICYDKQAGKIYIAWDRIRAYAILDKPLLLSRDKYTFFPFDPTPYFMAKGRICNIKQQRLTPCPLTLEQDRQLKILQALSPEDYKETILIGTKKNGGL